MRRIDPQAYLADVLSRPIWLMSSIASLITRSVRSTLCSHGAGQNSARQVAATNQKPRPTADAHGIGTIAGVAAKFGVHRRVVRQALVNAVPAKHHYPERAKPKLGALVAFIDEVLAADRQAARKQRHTARRLYRRILAEFVMATCACTYGASAVWFWSGDNLGV